MRANLSSCGVVALLTAGCFLLPATPPASIADLRRAFEQPPAGSVRRPPYELEIGVLLHAGANAIRITVALFGPAEEAVLSSPFPDSITSRPSPGFKSLRDTIALCHAYAPSTLPAPLSERARRELESAWRRMLATREPRR